MRLRFLMPVAAVLTALIAGTAVQAKTPDEIRAACRAEGRPCVGLVLSGGGARGFAHIGVLKEIERLGIKVDVVTGTSMGAIIGGAWAAGYSADEIEKIVMGVDWAKVLSVRPTRNERPWRDKLQDYQGLLGASVEITADGDLVFPKSVVASEELDLFLQNKTGRFDSITDLGDLPIPFACVATNLITGKKAVLQKDITLGRAMRASMSVPGAFAPAQYGDELLVDGGLVDNLPVDVARDMGADVVIAVNVGTPLSKREDIKGVLTVMAQMVNLLTEQNVEESLKSLGPKDILITPDLADVTSADLHDGSRIITRGTDAVVPERTRLAMLASKPSQWALWNRDREQLVREEEKNRFDIDRIRIDGLTYLDEATVRQAMDLPDSGDISRTEINRAARRLWGEGWFNGVNYSIEPGPDRTNVLVFNTQQKSPRYSSFRLGGSVQTDFNETHNYNLILSHTLEMLNPVGGAWHNEFQFGEQQRITTRLYQPLAAGSNWFVMPRLEFRRQPFDIYKGNHPKARYRNQTALAEFSLGRSFDFNGFAKASVGIEHQSTKSLIGEVDEQFDSTRTPYFSVGIWLDTLDDINFPTTGYHFNAQWERLYFRSKGTKDKNIYRAEGAWATSWGPWTLLLNGKVGQGSLPNAFSLGGAFELPGAPIGRWTGSDMRFGSVRLSKNVSDWIDLYGQPVWIGASLEAGRVWNKTPLPGEILDSKERGWHKAVGTYLGVDSFVGPMYLILGHTIDTGTSLYFYWGRSF